MMSPLYIARSDRWQSLVHASEHIQIGLQSGDFQRSEAAISTALEQIRSLKEIFGPTLDPTHDFEGFAVRQLLKSLESVLIRMPKPHA